MLLREVSRCLTYCHRHLSLFRLSPMWEFTCQSKEFDPSYNLKWSDVRNLGPNGFELNLPASKTDPFRKGVLIPYFANASTICPVKAMATYRNLHRLRQPHRDAPLLVTQLGAPLTRTFFLEKLAIMTDRLHYPPGRYSGHSFRSGAATTAAARQVPDHLIKTLGRWQSDCYNRYIKVSPVTIRDAQQRMSQ